MVRKACTIKIPIFVYYQWFCGLLLNSKRKQEVCLPYTTHICGSIPIRKQQQIFNGNVKRSIEKVITENTNWYISSENARTLFQLLNVIAVAMHFHMTV